MKVIDRRLFVSGAIAAASAPALAAAPQIGKPAPAWYRYRLGDFEITAISDGLWLREIDDKFMRNVTLADLQQALANSFQPTNGMPTPFTSICVNTGSRLVLIDTGTGGQLRYVAPQTGTWMANLAAAGIDPKDVDAVLISHFHFDHINGLKTKDSALVFPNAEIMVSSAEWTYWLDDARMNDAPEDRKPVFRNVRRIFGDIAKKVHRFEPGGELVPGITSIAAYGHTPGHTAYAVASGRESLLVIGDVAENPPVFMRHPEWQPRFDVDGPAAVDTRKRLLDRAAADRMLVQGYHFPFPACGHVARTATGYDLVPVTWHTTP
ncbi:MAG TPA: MBL fold metallo-hydrolase [Xanthobacteraceae bacterium]|nr:MBL fold metallo-hydrolase [Xanthobacteraceae bacterium]